MELKDQITYSNREQLLEGEGQMIFLWRRKRCWPLWGDLFRDVSCKASIDIQEEKPSGGTKNGNPTGGTMYTCLWQLINRPSYLNATSF